MAEKYRVIVWPNLKAILVLCDWRAYCAGKAIVLGQ